MIAIGAIASAASTIGGLFGGRSNFELKKDHLDAGFKLAMAGNLGAYDYIKGRAGYGPTTLRTGFQGAETKPWKAGQTVNASNTPEGLAYAQQLYAQLQAAAAAGSGGAAQAAGPGTPSSPTPASEAADAAKRAAMTDLAGVPAWALFAAAAALAFTSIRRR